ncbi:hypothetical protein EI94DRAFT_607704 [Lactarius quietus]|nr:hypothetical protein EI94DRAFT_607704 [Lactarius quietus]
MRRNPAAAGQTHNAFEALYLGPSQFLRTYTKQALSDYLGQLDAECSRVVTLTHLAQKVASESANVLLSRVRFFDDRIHQISAFRLRERFVDSAKPSAKGQPSFLARRIRDATDHAHRLETVSDRSTYIIRRSTFCFSPRRVISKSSAARSELLPTTGFSFSGSTSATRAKRLPDSSRPNTTTRSPNPAHTIAPLSPRPAGHLHHPYQALDTTTKQPRTCGRLHRPSPRLAIDYGKHTRTSRRSRAIHKAISG